QDRSVRHRRHCPKSLAVCLLHYWNICFMHRNRRPGENWMRSLAPSPPRDYDALKDLLLARREDLPRRLVQVAAFALENPDEIAFGTVASVAAQADVQPSTLIRFAQTLGY